MASIPALPENPQAGDPRLVGDLTANDTALMAAVNSVDASQLAANAVTTAALQPASVTADKLADAAKLGLSGVSTVRRGKLIIATEESTSSTSFTDLATPDRVQNVALPTDGLIFVLVTAQWKESVASAARAAVFIGSSQLQSPGVATAVSQEAELSLGGATDTYAELRSASDGLSSPATVRGSSPAATGQVVAQPMVIAAAAGTYDVGVKFKASSGSVSARYRKLWVWTMGF